VRKSAQLTVEYGMEIGERGGCANTHPHSDHPLACKEHKAND
jgi:hypothetical protein